MAATPLAELGAELRRTRPDLLGIACGDYDSNDALAAFLALPEQAEYFGLNNGQDGEVGIALTRRDDAGRAA